MVKGMLEVTDIHVYYGDSHVLQGVSLTGYGHLQKFVVFGVAAGRDALGGRHRFAAQQHQANRGANIDLGQAIFVADAGPVEHVYQLFQQRRSVKQGILAPAQALQHRPHRTVGLDQGTH